MIGDNAPGQSMEDILASIKRIITEDAPLSPAAPTPAADEDDVLELREPAPDVPAPPVLSPPLLSAHTADASRQALAALSAIAIDPAAGAGTLDGLVREMLRPLLTEWLDTHLPDLVERIVAREVARLGGR